MTVINVAEQKRQQDKRKLQDSVSYVVRIGGALANIMNGTELMHGAYHASPGDKVSIKFDILDKGVKRTDIDSIVFKTPLIKMFRGSAIDEMYLDVGIVGGAFTISGNFTAPGKWVLDLEEVNESLKRTGGDWKLSGDKLTFLV